MLWWAELSKTLIYLTVDGWGCVPSLLVVWPEATQHWSLLGLLGSANDRLWEGSCQGAPPRTSATSVPLPMVSHKPPPPRLHRRLSNTSRLVWFFLHCGHCSFPWVPMHTLLCVCPPRVESLFPPVLSKSCNQFPLGFNI